MPSYGGGRPNAYKLKDGTRVPGVTTITGRMKDSGGLIRWAYNCGRDGIDMDRARDGAASAGSIAHTWIDDVVHDRELTEFRDATEAQLACARSGLEAFEEWRDQVRLTILSTEVPLISEKYRFGGTYDAVAMVSGRRVILDYKTSNGVYPEYVMQVAAYRQLVREAGEPDPAAGYLLRIGKEYAEFSTRFWPEVVLDKGFRAFEIGREFYELDAILKKVAA